MRFENILVLFSWFAMSMDSLGSLVYQLPVEQRKSVREVEKLSGKLTKLKCSLLFNSTCLKEEILPNYSNIYIFSRQDQFLIGYHWFSRTSGNSIIH